MAHEVDQSFLALPLRALADAALARARALGAEHADFRLERVRSASWRLRDARPAGSSDTTDLGYAVRVVHGGAWGFASGVDLTMDAAAKVASQAVAMAKLSAQGDRGGRARTSGWSWPTSRCTPSGPGCRRTTSTRSPCRTRRRPGCSPSGARGCWRRTGVDACGRLAADRAREQVLRRHRGHRRPPSSGCGCIRSSPRSPWTGRAASSTRCAPSRRRSGRGWEYLTGHRLGLGRRAGARSRSCSPRRCGRPSVEAGAVRPGRRPVQPVADHPRVDRPRHRAGPRARLRGGVRGHLVRHLRPAGQAERTAPS